MWLSRQFSVHFAVIALGLSLPCAALAADQVPPPSKDNPLKDWTLTGGLQHSNSRRTVPAAASRNESNTLSISGVKRHDNLTFYGGSLGFNAGNAKSQSDGGSTDTKVVSGSVFVLRRVTDSVLIDANLAHGAVGLDNVHTSGGNLVTFDTDSSFWAAGAGATKIIPINKTVTATATGRYSFTYSDSNGYQDSANASTPGDTTNKSTLTFGGGVNWRLGKWQPSTKLNWNYASAALYNGTNDHDYFTYSIGTAYAYEPDVKVSVAYSGSLAKTRTRDHAIGVSVSRSF